MTNFEVYFRDEFEKVAARVPWKIIREVSEFGLGAGGLAAGLWGMRESRRQRRAQEKELRMLREVMPGIKRKRLRKTAAKISPFVYSAAGHTIQYPSRRLATVSMTFGSDPLERLWRHPERRKMRGVLYKSLIR